MKSFIFAVRFLTIIPLGFNHDTDRNTKSNSIVFFPLVGLLIGMTLAFAGKLLDNLLPEQLLCAVLVLALVFITGGLHIDGLADTIDGFYAGSNRDEILTIMRDSKVGTMGMVGIISIILLKIGFLTAFTEGVRFRALLIMPVISRWSMVMAIYIFDYVREQGKAECFFSNLNWPKLLVAALSTLAVVYIAIGFVGIAVILFITLATFICGSIIKKKIGGVTGDTLGALNEMNELLVLLLLYAGKGILN